MPTVQKQQRQVVLQELPGVRLTAAKTPESEGAGIAEAKGQQASALIGIGGKTTALGEELAQRERQRTDDTAILAADTDLGQWMTKRVYDPKTGALTVKGKDAQGLPEQISDEFNQHADRIEAGLSTPEQKFAFRRVRAERGLSLYHVIGQHALAESEQYEGQVAAASLVNSRNLAIASGDLRQIGIELQRQRDIVAVHGAHLGWSPEQIKEQSDANVSATHVGVIEKFLADEKPKAAQVWFEEAKAKSEINGDQIARIEKALHEGTTRKQGQAQADAIIAAGGTLTDQREKARQIDDADVRDQVMQRIEHEWSIKEVQQRQDAEAALSRAFTILDSTPNVAKIPPTAWVSFSGAERSSLRAYADRLAKGDPVETDWTQYYRLMTVAADDPASFASANLLSYRGYLGNGEFKQLTDLQLAIRNKDANALDKQVPGFRDREQIVNDTLTQYGIDPKSKPDTDEGRAIAQLRRMLDQRVDAAQAGGKKVTNTEVQQTLDALLGQSVTTPGSWWGLWPLSSAHLSTTTKRLIDMTAGDVPDAERTTIEKALRDTGRAVTDQTVLDTYLNVLIRRNYKARK
jgi:hypothetical protein